MTNVISKEKPCGTDKTKLTTHEDGCSTTKNALLDCATTSDTVERCDTTCHTVADCNTTERESLLLEKRTAALEEWRSEQVPKIENDRSPVKLIIHELAKTGYGSSWALIGKFTRKSKGKEYTSPRILLPWYFSKHIGKGVIVLEGKVSVEGFDWLQNKEALVLVLRK